jgi:hypothetical protein
MTFENFHEVQLQIREIKNSLEKLMDSWKHNSYLKTKLGHGN